MTARLSSLVLLVTLLLTPLTAKDKKKPALPEYVLRATTVRVVIDPDAGEPIDQPLANATARDNVEKALLQWGRLQPVLEGQESDLVIAVRTGNGSAVRRTIKGGPIDNRAGVAQPVDGGIRIGGQQGQPPPLEDPGMGGSRKMVRRSATKSARRKIPSRSIAAACEIRSMHRRCGATQPRIACARRRCLP